MRTISFCLIIMLLTSSLFFVNAEKSDPIIFYVDDIPGEGPDNPPEDFTNIQDAINAAYHGDTVYVYSGLYKGYQVKVIKSINLIGENKDTTIIDGESKITPVLIDSSNVLVKGFTVTNGKYLCDAGITIDNDFVRITDCIIQYNDCGIRIHYSKNIEIDNCTIQYNHAHSVYNVASSFVTITQSDIHHNGNRSDWSMGSIVLSPAWENRTCYNVSIQQCEIHDNFGNGISIGDGWAARCYEDIFIKTNYIHNNSGCGIQISKANGIILNNIIEFNGNGGTFHGGIVLQDVTEKVTIKNNHIAHNNRYGIFLLRSGINYIINNNIINNKYNAFFNYESWFERHNSWDGNYWDDMNFEGFKCIWGNWGRSPWPLTPFINIDRNPATEPYNIEVRI